MNQIRQESYINRIERVLDFIADHLDDDLSMKDLAEIACFSAYHFHRIYKGLVGETFIQTVRRLRLQRAASELIRTSSEIDTIAKRAGYGSVEAFSRAFKAAYRQAPASYRDHVRETPVILLQKERNTEMFDVEIKDLPARKMVAISHDGDYMQIGKTFDKVFMWGMKHNLINDQTVSLGLYYDDPSQVAVQDLRSKSGFVVEDYFEDLTIGLHTQEISAGRYAVLRFRGPYAELEKGYNYLFGPWLNENAEIPADAPVLECYLNDPRKTEPNALLTDICVLLR